MARPTLPDRFMDRDRATDLHRDMDTAGDMDEAGVPGMDVVTAEAAEGAMAGAMAGAAVPGTGRMVSGIYFRISVEFLIHTRQ